MTDTVDKAKAWDVVAEKNAEIVLLRNALEAIDTVAVVKKAGAAKKMQQIARDALHAHPRVR